MLLGVAECIAAVLVFLVLATLVLTYAVLSYFRTLETGVNAWWLSGEAGQRRGAALLRFLMRLAGCIGRRAVDRAMGRAAEAKAVKLAAEVAAASGSVCFLGSSTFTFWLSMAADMQKAGIDPSCFNAGFGGACTAHVLAHVENLCLRFRPAVIVYFCGTNGACIAKSEGRSVQRKHATQSNKVVTHTHRDACVAAHMRAGCVAPHARSLVFALL